MELAPPVLGGRIASRQGCRHLARYTRETERDIDTALCEQDIPRRWHNGLDIGASDGSPILAPWPGIIRRAYQLAGYYDPDHDRGSGGYGRTILVEHWPGCLGLYAHCEWTRDDVGAAVAQGEQLARVGRTCGSADDPTCTFSGPHVHLEFVKRWPLRSDQVSERWDVEATLRGMGIVERSGKFYWQDPHGFVAAGPGGTFPAEGIAPGQAMLISQSGATPGAPASPSGASEPLLWLAGAWALARRRRQA